MKMKAQTVEKLIMIYIVCLLLALLVLGIGGLMGWAYQ